MSVFRLLSKRIFTLVTTCLFVFIFFTTVSKADHTICDHPIPNTLECCIPELDMDCKEFSKITICHSGSNTIQVNLNALTNHFESCQYVEPGTNDSQPLETPQGAEGGMTVCAVTVGDPAPPGSQGAPSHENDFLGACEPINMDQCQPETVEEDCPVTGNVCSVPFCETGGEFNICTEVPAITNANPDQEIVCRAAGTNAEDEECDITEFCEINSTVCPEDNFVPFGGECTIEGCEGQDICDGMGTCICFEGEEPIPTLSEWGLIFLMAFLFMAAMWRMKKHQSV